jgi:autotransporter-associated beta strand protein
MRRATRRGAALAVLHLAIGAGVAAADIFVVDDADDGSGGRCPAVGEMGLPGIPGTCSLRSAIEAANATDGSDQIVFDPAVFDDPESNTIELASALPAIDGDLEINAAPLDLLMDPIEGLVLLGDGAADQVLSVVDGTAQLNDVTLDGVMVSVASGTRLVFEQEADASLAQSIADGGAIEKRGEGRLILTAANAYGGGTLVSEGTLQGFAGADGDNPGSLQGDITDNAVLVFDQPDDGQFFGSISGVGRVEKTGPGTLVLMTPNSYDGGTIVREGTLQGFAGAAGASGSLQGDITVDSLLIFAQDADGVFPDNIDGSGNVEKIGTGELELTGSNRYAGTTTIRAGILRGDADAIPGDVQIDAGASLVFDQTGAGTHAGDIGGIGRDGLAGFSVTKEGPGTLTLSGSNSYLGGTQVAEGTLRGTSASLQGDIALDPGTTLVFDQSFDGSYDDVLAGDGALDKEGSGRLTLSGDLSRFTGLTTIRGGRLDVDTALPDDVDVLSGVLGGTGSIAGIVDVGSAGTVAPGNSIGVLTVGEADFSSGSILQIETSPGAMGVNADRLDVSGLVTVEAGARIGVVPGSGDYPAPGTGVFVPILTSADRTGDFDVPTGTVFLDYFFDQSSSTQILLAVESNGTTLSEIAATRNQRAVAGALEEADANGSNGDLDDVFGALNQLQTEGQVQDALDAMAGEQLTQFATTRLGLGDRFHTTLQRRMQTLAWGETEALFGRSAPAPRTGLLARGPGLTAPGFGAPQLGAFASGFTGGAGLSSMGSALAFQPDEGSLGLGGWLDGYGLLGDVQGGSGSSDLDYTVWGVSLGLDYRVARNWVVGAAGGYAHTDLDFDDRSGSQDADTGQGALYGGYVSPRLHVGAAFRFGYNSFDTSRRIRFGSLDEKADADFDGIDLGGRVEAAANLFEVAGFAFQPVAAFTYAHLQQDDFDESGGNSALSLDVKEEKIDSAVSGLGARIHGLLEIGDEVWIRPELHGRWLHEFGDTDRRVTARIGGVPGASYKVVGAELPRDSGAVGVGWTVTREGTLHFFADYQALLNSDLVQHSFALGFQLLW